MELRGKSAVVTGGAVRLGRAIALRLAAEGMHVCVHYGHSAPAAAQTLAEIQQHGVRGTIVAADLRSPITAATDIFAHAERELGPLDVLINSAAIFEAGSLRTTDEADWDQHFNINLKSPFFLCQEFVRRLPSDRRGQIVNIADWRGERPRTGHAAYTLTKAALLTMTRLLSLELAPRIQVNAVAPGAILPPPGEDAAYLERLQSAIPLRRTGQPDDVADAVVFLLRAEFITGEVLHVTGGEHL